MHDSSSPGARPALLLREGAASPAQDVNDDGCKPATVVPVLASVAALGVYIDAALANETSGGASSGKAARTRTCPGTAGRHVKMQTRIQQLWGGTPDPARVMSSLVMLLLLRGPHLEL